MNMITLTDETIEAIVCPTWCERTDHHADVIDDDNPPVHYGKGFGPFFPQGVGDELREVVTCDSDVVYPIDEAVAELRQIAADALAAAAWVEARQAAQA